MSFRKMKAGTVADLLGTSPEMVRRLVVEHEILVERVVFGATHTRMFSIENVYELAAAMSQRRAARRRVGAETKPRRPITAVVYAPKGGVGKSTIAHNVSSYAPLLGVRTLAIDLDFQSNLTLAYNYDSDLTREEADQSGLAHEKIVECHLGHLFADWPTGSHPLSDVIKYPYGKLGPALIPADLTLDRLDTMLTYDLLEGRGSDTKIARLLNEATTGKNPRVDLTEVDLILIDAAPAKNRMTRGALLAADYVICPVSMAKFSTKALSYLATVLTEMSEQSSRSPELIIVGNFFDQTRVRVAAQLMTISAHYQSAWLESTIRASEEFPRSLEADLPIWLYQPRGEAARDMVSVTRNLLTRMGIISRDHQS